MKTYNEIRQIITEKLGYTDLASYQKVAYGEKRTTPLTQEELTQLSPDVVNNQDFWLVSRDLFNVDPVCNQQSPTSNLLHANRQNLQLARLTGCIGWVDAFLAMRPQGRILEIGPGYGCFKNYIESNYLHAEYYGMDVYPLIPEIQQAEADGTIPRKMVVESVLSMVYSSNVFQHLSPRQRSQYYADAKTMLADDGVFIFNLLTCDNNAKFSSGGFDENGRGYLGHYGQFTLIPTFKEVADELRANDFDLYAYQLRQMDGLTSFFAIRRKRPVETKQEENVDAIS